MKKFLIMGIIVLVPFAFLVFKEESPPKVVVETLFERVAEVKHALKKTKEEGSSEAAAQELSESKASVQSLFLNPRRAKVIMFSLMILDLEEVTFLEERTDGKSAEVIIEHIVVDFGQQATLNKSAQKRNRIIFQLKKEKGQWKIVNIK